MLMTIVVLGPIQESLQILQYVLFKLISLRFHGKHGIFQVALTLLNSSVHVTNYNPNPLL